MTYQTTNDFNLTRQDGTYTGATGELVVSDGGTITLPTPTAGEKFGVRALRNDVTLLSNGSIEASTSDRRIDSEGNSVFVSDGTEWYLVSGNEYFGFDIPDAGLLHRYDATELNLNDGDSFFTLSDEAGNDDLSSGSGGKYNTNGLNGNPVISFSRSNYIETSGGFSSSTPSTWAMFFVAKDNPDSGSFDSLWDDQADSRQHNLYNDNDSPDWELRSGGLRINNADSNWHIWSYEVDGNGNTLIIEDESSRSSSGDNSQQLDGLTLGAESGGNDDTAVDYGEILIYDTSDSGYSKTDVLSYLSDKWGITV